MPREIKNEQKNAYNFRMLIYASATTSALTKIRLERCQHSSFVICFSSGGSLLGNGAEERDYKIRDICQL
jgi:hypothetical protein